MRKLYVCEQSYMRRLSLCVVAVFVLLTGCKKDISGTYLTSDNSTVLSLQLVRTPDNHLTGQLAASVMKPDGSIDRNSAPITGAVDGENVTLSGSRLFGLQTLTLSGTLEGDKLTLTGVEPTPMILTRSTLTQYQAQVAALDARSQSILALRTAAMSRERTEQAQKNFVAQIDQLITKMQRFDAAADVNLSRLPNVEKGYQAITVKMNGYVERERQLAGDSNASNTRSQLSNAATQASFVTDQVHNQGQSLQWTFDNNVKPIAAEVTNFEQRCQTVTANDLTPAEVDAIKAACGRLTNAAPLFHEKYNAMVAGLAHLEQVYTNESKAQQALLQTADKLQ
jgi:hypothetical protein